VGGYSPQVGPSTRKLIHPWQSLHSVGGWSACKTTVLRAHFVRQFCGSPSMHILVGPIESAYRVRFIVHRIETVFHVRRSWQSLEHPVSFPAGQANWFSWTSSFNPDQIFCAAVEIPRASGRSITGDDDIQMQTPRGCAPNRGKFVRRVRVAAWVEVRQFFPLHTTVV